MYFYHSIPERMSAVMLLFTEAGAAVSLQNKRFLKTPRKACNCAWKGLHHECFAGKFPKVFAAATMSKH